MLNNIKATLEDTLERLGLKQGIENHKPLVCWKEVVGNKVASHTQPTRIRKGVLFVNASSSVWAQELSLVKKELTEKINKHLKNELVKDIRFSSRGIKAEESTDIKRTPQVRKTTLSSKEIGAIKKTTQGLENQEIRESLERVIMCDKKYKKQQETGIKKKAKNREEPLD